MKARIVIIIGAIVWIFGTILFFLSPVIFVQTWDPSLSLMMSGIGTVCIAIGFFTFFGGMIYWFITRPRKIMIVDESGRPIKQQTVVQTKEKEIKTFDKTITETIKCPACGGTQQVSGVLGEKVEVTCKKCNGKGVFHFR